MAETLGSLVDKLTIKDLREFYIQQLLHDSKFKRFSRKNLRNKLKILKLQKKALISEIEDFMAKAAREKVVVTDYKLKLYNKPSISKIGKLKDISSSIDKLAKKNIELWHLEDEGRRENMSDAHIGMIKKRIDRANQERNDLIDAIDYLFKKHIKKGKK